MSIAVLLPSDFVIIVAEDHSTGIASEASWMEFSASINFQILAFDATVAATADGPVELVVMALAVRRVVENIKLCCWEWVTTCPTCEALLVVAPSDASRGVLDRFPHDRLRTSTTIALACRSSVLSARSCLW